MRRAIRNEEMSPQIEIYTTRYCPYCTSAKALFKRKGVAFKEIELDGHGPLQKEMIKRANGRITVPQIFIGERHIGGCDDLQALERAGELDRLLEGHGPINGQNT
jgi:glutaredoxin 3